MPTNVPTVRPSVNHPYTTLLILTITAIRACAKRCMRPAIHGSTAPTVSLIPVRMGTTVPASLVKKYLDTTRAPTNYSTRSDQDFVLLRYADILLMYAEAQNEVAGPGPDVYNAVNAVRARKGIQMPPLPAGLSQADMRLRIRRERRVESLRWKAPAILTCCAGRLPKRY